jgi:hypothetical protein
MMGVAMMRLEWSLEGENDGQTPYRRASHTGRSNSQQIFEHEKVFNLEDDHLVTHVIEFGV